MDEVIAAAQPPRFVVCLRTEGDDVDLMLHKLYWCCQVQPRKEVIGYGIFE